MRSLHPHFTVFLSDFEVRKCITCVSTEVLLLISCFSHLFAAHAGKLSDMKSTWSQGPISHTQVSLSHELWKVPQGPRNTTAPTRPPPGLTNTKPSSTWGGNSLGLVPGWSGSYSSGTFFWMYESVHTTEPTG